MKRELILAVIAAFGLAACGTEVTESQPPPTASAAPAQPVEAAQPAAADTAVARADKVEPAAPASADGKEDEKKDDGEKKPQ